MSINIDPKVRAAAQRKIDQEGLSETVGWAIDALGLFIDEARVNGPSDPSLALAVLDLEPHARPLCDLYVAAADGRDWDAANEALDDLRHLFSED